MFISNCAVYGKTVSFEEKKPPLGSFQNFFCFNKI